jgi:ribosome biogenesis GTP-binding protein YlqF
MTGKFFEELLSKSKSFNPEKINWFPGHMHKATNELKSNFSSIDIFLEVRDARLPLSSKNFEIDEAIRMAQKSKLILFNKYDLCNQRVTSQAIEKFNSVGINCLTISAKDGKNLEKLVNYIQQKQTIKYKTVGLWMMIGGMPNVGKSTIINNLRESSLSNKKAIAKTAPLPCTTKSLNGFKINDNPLAYLVDTPGIMVPKIIDNETGLKLALVGCIRDKITGKEPIIEYMVWALNKLKVRNYVDYYGMNGLANNAKDIVFHCREKYRQFNYETTYDMILKDFREGKLGKVSLDDLDFLRENE